MQFPILVRYLACAKMMKLLLLACLVAVCSAAPPVPKVAETFCADGEIEFHGSERTLFGKCANLITSCILSVQYSCEFNALLIVQS